MRFDQYQSEEQAYRHLLISSLKGHEDALMTIFIQQGPQTLREHLHIKRENDWNIIFDYLVFSKDVLKRCVLGFLPFFKDLVRTQGPLALRRVFGIENRMYDTVFETLFDFVAVAHGALFEYLHDHSAELLELVKRGEGSCLRAKLGLDSQKYDYLWEEVLEFMAHSFHRLAVAERMAEQRMALANLLESII